MKYVYSLTVSIFIVLGLVFASPSSVSTPYASVVRVAGYSVCGDGSGHGSWRQGTGWVAGAHEVITDAHVIYGTRNVDIQVNDVLYTSTVVYFSPSLDLAVLRTNAPLPHALGIDNEADPGDSGVMAGYPVHSRFRLRNAKITGVVKNTQTGVLRHLFEVRTDAIRGESGGPLLIDGRVAGMFELFIPGKDTGFFIMHHDIIYALGHRNHVSHMACGPIR
jgi:S1-C subfamily serine protease